jgi:hypothetical protein
MHMHWIVGGSVEAGEPGLTICGVQEIPVYAYALDCGRRCGSWFVLYSILEFCEPRE